MARLDETLIALRPIPSDEDTVGWTPEWAREERPVRRSSAWEGVALIGAFLMVLSGMGMLLVGWMKWEGLL